MAIRKIVNRANKSFNYTLPSPIGGLNARDSLDAMKENEAITMDNYIPHHKAFHFAYTNAKQSRVLPNIHQTKAHPCP